MQSLPPSKQSEPGRIVRRCLATAIRDRRKARSESTKLGADYERGGLGFALRKIDGYGASRWSHGYTGSRRVRRPVPLDMLS